MAGQGTLAVMPRHSAVVGAVRDNRVGLDVAADAVDIPAGDAGCRISENRPR